MENVGNLFFTITNPNKLQANEFAGIIVEIKINNLTLNRLLQKIWREEFEQFKKTEYLM